MVFSLMDWRTRRRLGKLRRRRRGYVSIFLPLSLPSFSFPSTSFLTIDPSPTSFLPFSQVPEPLTPKPRIPHANKILAHRALKTGLRFGYDNWRMWSNYLLVSIDLGENSEACRALTRVVEERARKDGEDCVDSDVLDRLVSAVTKGAQPGSEEALTEAHSPNEGKGLLYNLSRVFDDVILPRISSSPRIYRSQARLLTWEGKIPEALDAHVKAYRASVVNDELVEREVGRWREAVEETKEVAEMMMGLGPKAVVLEEKKLVEGEKPVWKDWKFQARSMVRSFMGEYIFLLAFREGGGVEGGLNERTKKLTTRLFLLFFRRSHKGRVRGSTRVGYVEGDLGRSEECMIISFLQPFPRKQRERKGK